MAHGDDSVPVRAPRPNAPARPALRNRRPVELGQGQLHEARKVQTHDDQDGGEQCLPQPAHVADQRAGEGRDRPHRGEAQCKAGDEARASAPRPALASSRRRPPSRSPAAPPPARTGSPRRRRRRGTRAAASPAAELRRRLPRATGGAIPSEEAELLQCGVELVRREVPHVTEDFLAIGIEDDLSGHHHDLVFAAPRRDAAGSRSCGCGLLAERRPASPEGPAACACTGCSARRRTR